MKKLTFILTSLFILSIGMASCDKEEESEGAKIYSSKEGRININETEFVRMYYSPQTGDVNSPAELIFENQTEGTFIYGLAFSLEYFENNSWIEIPLLDINFEDIGLSLKAGETGKRSFNPVSFIKKYNKGKKGKYRYVKKMDLSYDFPFGEMNGFTMYVEFEIE